MERNQINLKLSDELGKLIDAKRISLMETTGKIPTRSDILRQALAMYLEVDLSQTEQDQRKKKKVASGET